MNICRESNCVDFGSSLPGYVLEEVLVLKNLSSVPFSVKITVLCFDEELNELDEYVFSIRKEENYEYNESLICKIPANESIKSFVALKAPNLKFERKIPGILQVRVNGASCVTGIFSKEISAFIKIPKIVCLKELYSTQYQQQLIKLAMKINNGKTDCKVPFKNLMPFAIKAEFELIQNQSNDDQFEFSINPEFGVLQPNQMAMIVIVGRKNEFKVNKEREGFKHLLSNQLQQMLVPKKKKWQKEKIERNVLLLIKIVHSTIILCFPTIIEVY